MLPGAAAAAASTALGCGTVTEALAGASKTGPLASATAALAAVTPAAAGLLVVTAAGWLVAIACFSRLAVWLTGVLRGGIDVGGAEVATVDNE